MKENDSKTSTSPAPVKQAKDAWWKKFERHAPDRHRGWRRGRGEVGKNRI